MLGCVSFFGGGNGRKRNTRMRIVVWVVAAGVGIYLLTSGIVGIVTTSN